MPQHLSKLDIAMGIKAVTKHTMGNAYMRGWHHFQEAGHVLLDKRRHFGMLIGLLASPIWEQIAMAPIW